MPKENVSAEKKIENIMMRLTIEFPFFSVLLFHLGFEERTEDWNKTMCTNGKVIYYNKNYVDNLTYGECAFVIVHEVMHCALSHLWRRGQRDHEMWNFATDFAVNGIINEVDAQREKVENAFHLTMPKGCLYNKDFLGKFSEEIYTILQKNNPQSNNNSGGNNGSGSSSQQVSNGSGGNGSKPNKRNQNNSDGSGNGNSGKKKIKYGGKTYNAPENHQSWDEADGASEEEKRKQQTKWDGNLLSAAENMKDCGEGVAGLKRILDGIRKPQKDWRVLLNEFIEYTNFDYAFMPPDCRYECEFFLPDFNDVQEVVNDVLFFVDTSGSMGEKEIQACYSEIQGAIHQFGNNLHGTLLFFDADVSKHYYNFDDHDGDISKLIPYGGGGTSYSCIFDFVKKKQGEFTNINGIIILTDGYCDYPDERVTQGIPVLWVYTTPDNKPPFGAHTTLTLEE